MYLRILSLFHFLYILFPTSRSDISRSVLYQIAERNKVIVSGLYSTKTQTLLDCARTCIDNGMCISFSYHSNGKLCALSASTSYDNITRDDANAVIYSQPITSQSCTDPSYVTAATSFNPCSHSNKLTVKVALPISGSRLFLVYTNGKYSTCNTYDDVRNERSTTCDVRKTLAGDVTLDPHGYFSSELPEAAAGYVDSDQSKSIYILFKGNNSLFLNFKVHRITIFPR